MCTIFWIHYFSLKLPSDVSEYFSDIICYLEFYYVLTDLMTMPGTAAKQRYDKTKKSPVISSIWIKIINGQQSFNLKNLSYILGMVPMTIST